MSLTESTMLPLGTAAPDFELTDAVSGNQRTFGDVAGSKGTLVMFLSAHCPFVVHIQEALGALSREYASQPVGWAAVGSNATENEKYAQDRPQGLAAQAQSNGFEFPYLVDESQDVAKAYTAACTPDFFLFDGDRRLVYRGQFDSSRPSTGTPATGDDLRAALDALISGAEVPQRQMPSIGCNIKWRPGAEPAYFG